MRSRVMTTTRELLRNAVVELISTDAAAVPRVAVTDANGVVTFDDMASGSLQLIVSADGFVTSTMRIANGAIGEVLFTLSRGYRVIAGVELPATAGPQLVHVMNDANASMDDILAWNRTAAWSHLAACQLARSPPERTSSSYTARVDAGANASASWTTTYTR